MITTVVFDLDDTLYPEVDYCKSGFSAAAEFAATLPRPAGAITPAEISDCLWTLFSAGNHTTTFNQALQTLGIDCDEKVIRQLVTVYRNHTPAIELPETSKKVLDELKQNYALAMLTDGFLPAQKLKVQALGIEYYFQYIVYTEELGREFWKPSPVGFQKILEELNVAPQNCVYIADNPQKDFIAPNSLGFTTIQLLTEHRVHTAPAEGKNAAAGHKINDITQLPRLLQTF